jgi:adenylate cyclase
MTTSPTVFDLFDVEREQATILVVDDSVPSARLLEIQLGQAGYDVILAYNGEEGLAKVEESAPDLIILDVMMPGLDGFSVCEQLKSNKKTWFIPIILLTALNQFQDRIRGIRVGADDFLSKPFKREELLARVHSLLRLKSAYDALQTERNHLALLYSIGQEINSRLASDEVLGKIVTLTRKALGANMCSIIICDEAQVATQQIISRVGQPPAVVGTVTPAIFEEGLGGWILRNQESTIVEDTSQDQRWLVLPRDTEPVGSAIGAPLAVGDETIGILLLTHALPNYFHDGHLTVLTSIAAQASVTVRNARLFEAEQQRRQDLELLQTAGVALSAELNREALVRLIAHQGSALLNTAAASVMLLNEAENQLTIAAWQGFSERYAQRERVPVSELDTLLGGGQRSFQLSDLSQQRIGRSDLARREGMACQLSLALVVSEQFMGLLNLYRDDQSGTFSADEVKLAETFAQQAAVALSNADLLARTREERGKLSAVLSSTTDAVLAVDETGNLILFNPAARQTFGLNTVQVEGQPLAGTVPTDLQAIFQQVKVTGKPVSSEIELGDGKQLYVSVAPVAGVGQVAVVQDITPLKELEAMRLAAEQEERHRIRQLFERYVSPELVDRIIAQEAGLLDRRERRDVVVLFTDLRGFTRMTATFPAHTVIEVLNEFFTAVVNVVYTHEGTVFDLAGDELEVGFGAPLAQEDAAQRALRTAGDMQKVFAKLRDRWKQEQGLEVGLGVGIDRGSVVMGSIGAPSQMNFGLVGDAVSTAHGLVDLAQHGEIVVSEAFVEHLREVATDEELANWTFERRSPVRIKGKSVPVQIYRAHLQEDGSESASRS